MTASVAAESFRPVIFVFRSANKLPPAASAGETLFPFHFLPSFPSTRSPLLSTFGTAKISRWVVEIAEAIHLQCAADDREVCFILPPRPAACGSRPLCLTVCPSSGSPHSPRLSQPSPFSSPLPSLSLICPLLACQLKGQKGGNWDRGVCVWLTAFYRTHNHHSPCRYLLMMCGSCLTECQTRHRTLPYPPDTNLPVTLVSTATHRLPSRSTEAGHASLAQAASEAWPERSQQGADAAASTVGICFFWISKK